MQFQKITLPLAAVAGASMFGCTGTHEAGATNTTPDPRINPSSVQSDRGMSSSTEATVGRNAVANTNGSAAPSIPRSPADTDTTAPRIVVGNHPTPPVLDSLIKGTLPVRGLYVFRFGANTHRLKHLIGIADSTEVNALIIDVKDEFGLNYESSDPLVKKNAGTQVKAHNLGALVDTIRAHGILPVARIVVFKDSVTARNNPNHTIRKADGTAWHDKKGQTWVNPYANAIWEYNFRVAEEAIKMGFGEIQFDYIRFPEPYKSLPPQVFPEQAGRTKPQVLAEFLSAARARFAKLGVRTTADIFGLVTTVGGALEVGQKWEPIASSVDVVLPMVYPSHYPPGSFQLPHPNADPYDVIHIAISRARERDAKMGITGDHVRPWLQAFSIGNPKYGPHELEEQKRGVYDSGYDGWVLWEPGSRYDKFLPALEKTFVSRKKNPPVPRPANRLD
ncbi:MAG TPA: putative glycoside hydrolase [Gemmatimonadaceae bacterium]|nr:putative glycoside hydrolase [Gemmatimonadaceae bacterium]